VTEVDSLRAPHGRPGAFFCPWLRLPIRARDLLRWWTTANPYRAERRRLGRQGLGAALAAQRATRLAEVGCGAALTWIGQSTFVIQDGGDTILTDPHWGPRAFGPPRLVEPGLPFGALPEYGLALLSHDHYDHLDRWTAKRLPEGFEWLVPLGLGRWFAHHVGSRVQVRELDWWESVAWRDWRITCLPAQHWSNRLGHRRNSVLWCSWLFENGQRRYYFAGDSGYFTGFAEYGRLFQPIDVALLPIGAYEPRWFMRFQHMDPAEAYQAFLDLGARRLVGMHWGTFDLTDEPANAAPAVLREEIARRGGELERVSILDIGGRLEIQGVVPARIASPPDGASRPSAW
jgi:N-acyl-phosphatidylethanolamine-hydrolysing phospholipase D